MKSLKCRFYCKLCGKLLYRVIINRTEAGSRKTEENSLFTIRSNRYK